MRLNPRKYDITELRALVDSDAGTVTDGGAREQPLRPPNRNRAEAAVRAETFRETLMRQRAGPSPADRTRPYLESVPGGAAAEREVGEWIGYLVDVGGELRSRDALSYYREVGWISSDVEDSLTKRIPGYDEPQHTRAFTPADHRISLLSVVRLASCTQP